MYICIREDRERHDGFCEKSTVDSLHAARCFNEKILPKQPAYSLGNCFVMWQMKAC